MRTMLSARVFGVLSSLLLLCSCATQQSTRSRLPADVPFNQNAGRGGWLIVTVRLESGEQLPFLLDTGSPMTWFDKSQEPKLGKRLDTLTAWNFGAKQEAGLYTAPKLYLGSTPLLMTRTNIGSYDCKRISTNAHPPIMGIFGMDCLEHYCIQLDFAARKVRFLDDERTKKKGWGKPFPLTDRGDGCLLVSENLTGAKGPGSLIDTGCDYDGWLTPDVFQQWTNRAKLPADGEVRSPTGTLGGETYPQVPLDGLDPKLVLTEEGHLKYNGIGLRFLARHLVTLDFPKRTLYLKRTSPGPLIDREIETWARAEGKRTLRFLSSLKHKGQLPGWSKNDKAAGIEHTFNYQYPDWIAFNHLLKQGDSSIYHGLLGLVWVNFGLFWLRSKLKRAGGRAASLCSRPPAVKGSFDLRWFPSGFRGSDFRQHAG